MEKGIYGNGQKYESYLENGGMVDGKIQESFIDKQGNTQYIYMASNAFEEGREWEREAQISYFNTDQVYQFERNVGIRISGESTRSRSHKSLKLYARDIYGDGNPMNLEWNGEERAWKEFKLRNGGNECDTNKIKDAFIQTLVKECNVATQDASPCILFINGEYWGFYFLTERYTEEYFQKYYGISEDNILMIDSGGVAIGEEEDYEEYLDLINYLSGTDFTDKRNYDELLKKVDMSSFIDFYCINLYIDNQDIDFGRNMALWKSKRKGTAEYEDERWRWMIFDLDITARDPAVNSFDESLNDLMKDPIIKNLAQSDEFKKQFEDRFFEIAENIFSYEKVNDELKEWGNNYRRQIIKTQKQFVSEEYDETRYWEYMKEIDRFFEQRPKYIFTYLENYIE